MDWHDHHKAGWLRRACRRSIIRSGDTYTLPSDIKTRAENATVIQRPNAILDGGGHTISGAYAAVFVKGTQHVTIRNLKTERVSISVYLINSNYATITNNEFHSATFAVHILESAHVTVEHNTFTGGGIYIHYYSPDVPEINNVVRDNTVNGLPLVYLEGESGKTITGKLGQLVIVNCTNIKAVDVEIGNLATSAIQIINSQNITVTGARISKVKDGITIALSKQVTVKESVVKNPRRYGIELGGSSQILVTNNSIIGNNYSTGIIISHSTIT